MTKLPKAALLAALMFGTAGVSIATPAFAKKKDEAPAGGTVAQDQRERPQGAGRGDGFVRQDPAAAGRRRGDPGG